MTTSAIRSALDKLIDLNADHLHLLQRSFNAADRKIFTVDFLAMAALNRSMSNIKGFSAMMEQDNYLLVSSILRLQLDTVLRFFALHLVDNPHDLAAKILHGDKLKDIQDRSKKKMSDRHLCESFAEKEQLPWVKTVYERTSGFIHLSEKHIFTMFTHGEEQREDERLFQIAIGSGGGQSVPEETKIESIQCMEHITKLLLTYVYGWVRTKELEESLDPPPEDSEQQEAKHA